MPSSSISFSFPCMADALSLLDRDFPVFPLFLLEVDTPETTLDTFLISVLLISDIDLPPTCPILTSLSSISSKCLTLVTMLSLTSLSCLESLFNSDTALLVLRLISASMLTVDSLSAMALKRYHTKKSLLNYYDSFFFLSSAIVSIAHNFICIISSLCFTSKLTQ